MRFCAYCGAQVEDGQNFCTSCGNSTESAGVGAVAEMGLLGDKATTGALFDKMESNKTSSAPVFTPEEIAEREERARIERAQQQRNFERAYLQNHNSKSNNYFLGFVGALLGGLVGAIPWALVSSQGWFVAWLGYLIAICASKGYDLMKVKTSLAKLWCVGISVVIGVFVGQIMSDMLAIAIDPELSGMFSMAFSYYAENFGEYLSINAANLALGLGFAALGGYSVLKDINKENDTINEIKARTPEGNNL